MKMIMEITPEMNKTHKGKLIIFLTDTICGPIGKNDPENWVGVFI